MTSSGKSQLTNSQLPALSPACTSENTTKTSPVMQIAMPANFLNLYFVLRNIQVRNMTEGIDQQSRSMTLVNGVY